MFCNYCRQLNPNDAVYCSACGRDIAAALGGQKPSGTGGKNLVSAPIPGDSTPVGNKIKADSPVAIDSFSTEELKQYTDHQLDELWRSYIRLQIVPNLAVQQEIQHRALLTGRSAMESSATSSAHIVPTAPPKIQPEIPQPTTSLPEPTGWMTLLNSDVASQQNHAGGTKSTIGSAEPPISKNSVKVEERVKSEIRSQSPANSGQPIPRGAELPHVVEEIRATGSPVPHAPVQTKAPSPKSSDLSSLDYEKMSDEELGQIQSAYAKVRVGPHAALLKELDRRSREIVLDGNVEIGTNEILNEAVPGSIPHSIPLISPAVTQGSPTAEPPTSSPHAVDSSPESKDDAGLSMPVYGSLGHRFTAYFADLIVIYLLVITVYFVSAMFQLSLSASDGESKVVTFIAIFIYMVIAQSAYHTTIGKYIHRIGSSLPTPG